MLDVREKDLIYYAVRATDRYRAFLVRKRSKPNEFRTLKEPLSGLKIIQQKLVQVLNAVYDAPASVHGFVPGRSIATNAAVHEGQSELLNMDIKNFFDSINFGRVWGMLRAGPYNLPWDIATMLAQLCVDENAIPQGAPTSPVISNMVTRPLDGALLKLARRRRVRVTRYADDITLSSETRIPRDWIAGGASPSEGVTVAGALRTVIEDNGFAVNEAKVRLQARPRRMEVTGLTVNERVNVPRSYVRRIRSMLYVWERYGEQVADDLWVDKKDRHPEKAPPSVRYVLDGMIAYLGMVRGFDDPVFDRLYTQFCTLAEVRARPIESRPWNHVRRTEDAVWVLESDSKDTQGTGFFLEGCGFVTCAHVVKDDTHVFLPRRPGARFPVSQLALDKGLDLAILKIDVDPPYMLTPGFGHTPRQGDSVFLLGYPDYNPGSSIWVGANAVSGHRRWGPLRRITLSQPITRGMSGGPVFDSGGRVVGITATDPERYNSVIPVDALLTLLAEPDSPG